MKATITQAENNDRNLTIRTVTTNSSAIDDFNSEFGDKVDGRNRRKVGYESLCNEIIRTNGY